MSDAGDNKLNGKFHRSWPNTYTLQRRKKTELKLKTNVEIAKIQILLWNNNNYERDSRTHNQFGAYVTLKIYVFMIKRWASSDQCEMCVRHSHTFTVTVEKKKTKHKRKQKINDRNKSQEEFE